MTRRTNQRSSLIAGLVVASLVVAACGSDDDAGEADPAPATDAESGTTEPSEEPDPSEGRTLRIAEQEAPDPFDPATLSGNRSIELAQNVFSGLTGVDADTFDVLPGIATSWDVSDDGLEYTFTIRDDVRFHSGKLLTAADVEYTLNRAVDPDVRSNYAFFLGPIEGFADVGSGEAETLAGVEAVDDSTLVIRLSRPAGYMPSLLSLWPYWSVDQETIEAHGDDWVNPPNVNGTGAYRLVEQTADTEYVFEAFEDYWGGAPSIQRVVVTIVPESATALARYQAGEFDVIRNLSAATYRQVQSDPELLEQLGTEPLLGTTYFHLRNDVPPFDDIRVREAFNLAIDRDAIIEIALGGLGSPASTFLPPGLPGNIVDERDPLELDVERAQELLAEAGYPGGDGFPETSLYFNARDDFQAVNELVQAQLSQNLGVDIVLAPTPSTAYNELLNDPERRPTFSMYSFSLDYPDPQEMHEYLAKSQPGGFANYGNFSDPEFDALVDQANSATDPAERYELHQQADRIFLDAWAIVPLYHRLATWLAKPDVEGFRTTPLYMARWETVSFR